MFDTNSPGKDGELPADHGPGTASERALALASLDAQAVVDLVADPIVVTDRERRIVLWNRAAEVTYGFGAAEALGKRAAELLRTRFPMPLAEILEVVGDTGQWAGILVHHTKDGGELTVESRWTARYDESARLARILAIDRDVTARLADAEALESERLDHTQLEVQLERSQRLESVGQIAGGIAHDFNNSLGVIINYAAFVARELGELESETGDPRWGSMRADVAQIEVAAERAARLTRQLLAFSRQEVARPVALDLNETIRGVGDLLGRTVGEHVELALELAGDLHPIYADAGRLQQVLVDVAVNSRDAMLDGGKLTIETANVEIGEGRSEPGVELAPGSYVRLSVSDTGGGMSPDVLARAFDPFFTTKPLGRGTGLGLASVYGIVADLGGVAQLSSELGVGTTFSAVIPAGDTAPLHAWPLRLAASPTGTETVLLVEDEDALRTAAERILAGAGYRVFAAHNGPEALAIARSYAGPIHLLLTDVVMPEMPGHRLAEQLCRLRPSLRVLYMSGFAEAYLDQSMHVQEADLIEKPFTASALLQRVQLAVA